MTKSASRTVCKAATLQNLDQALGGLLNTLRKPLKLTATLKRRALKKKAVEKSAGIAPSLQPAP